MTAHKNTESSQGTGDGPPPPPPPPSPGQLENLRCHGGNAIFKSGPLFISSKGIGWTSWKKRWFILTKTSLVFFRSDPSAIPQKGSEVNLTLGGIDLNNSGSVAVKADKKLLTVLFPDGRAFTLKAETSEDLYEWKTALEDALAQAPSASLMMGQNGIFQNDHADGADGTLEQSKDKQPVKSVVIGIPILLALEDVDGSPSFLEKALRFIEEHGIKVEGILRQAAAVDDVEHRIKEFEQGKMEFSPEEDAHVIADCVKYCLRELSSSPVPASCCNALLEACRTDRDSRVNAMRAAICETFPDPNRRLLQRILLMMQTVASHKAVNRMSTSAVAACMAPLLLRPLLAGDCEIETNFNVGGDGSIQLLQAAAAANHAQAIVITLLEQYDKIFSEEGSMSPGLYSDSEEYGSEDEEVTEDDESYVDDEHDYATEESDVYTDDDHEYESSGTCAHSAVSGEDDLSDNKDHHDFSSGSKSIQREADIDLEVKQKLPSSPVQASLPQHHDVERNEDVSNQSNGILAAQSNESDEPLGDVSAETSLENKLADHKASTVVNKTTTASNGPVHGKRPTVWGRTSAKKNLSMESIDFSLEDDVEIQNLEASKIDLQNRISEEIKGNTVLQANLEKRKNALHERRLALQQDVARLEEQLQKERDKRKFLEAGLSTSKGPLQVPATIDEKTKADIEEIIQAEADVANLKQKVVDIGAQLDEQCEETYGSVPDSSNQTMHAPKHKAKGKERKDTETTATSQLGRSASKDTSMDRAERQQLDSAHSSSTRPIASTNSKRSGTRSEGVNSTTSALTRLTTRLNFLKERRSQIANELQNLDKDRASGLEGTTSERGRGSEFHQSPQNLEKSQRSEVPSLQNIQKDSQSVLNLDKGFGKEGKSPKKSEKSRKSDGQLHQDLAGGKHSDPQVLGRGKTGGHVSYNGEKGQGSEGPPKLITRNNSR